MLPSRPTRAGVTSPPKARPPLSGPMTFELGNHESLAEGVLRAAAEEIDGARSDIVSTNGDIHDRVHGARKRIKRARALVRLTAGMVPSKQRRDENVRLRDAAKVISEARDHHVIACTATRFAQEGGAVKRLLTKVAKGLESERARPAREDLAAVAARLEKARCGVQQWRSKGASVPAKGLHLTYAGGRSAMRKALSLGGSQAFHEWRKRTKDLRHQLEFLSSMWPGVFPELAKELNHLTDLLGTANDLTLLAGELDRAPLPAEDEPDCVRVLRFLAERRDELWHRALRAGERIYAKEPAAFAERMEAYWVKARAS